MFSAYVFDRLVEQRTCCAIFRLTFEHAIFYAFCGWAQRTLSAQHEIRHPPVPQRVFDSGNFKCHKQFVSRQLETAIQTVFWLKYIDFGIQAKTNDFYWYTAAFSALASENHQSTYKLEGLLLQWDAHHDTTRHARLNPC